MVRAVRRCLLAMLSITIGMSCAEDGAKNRPSLENPSASDASTNEPQTDAAGGTGNGSSDAGDDLNAGSSATDADANAIDTTDATDATPIDPRPHCNGLVELCAKRYDAVAYPTTHNAMSARESAFLGPNQEYGIAKQLDAGIRALMLDVYDSGGVPYLCHANCAYGSTPFDTALQDIASFLETHPDEVLSIIFEMYAPPAAIHDAFVKAHLEKELHVQELAKNWPTLREMIDAKQRIVVFTDRDAGAYAWYHDVWKHAFETPFAVSKAADLSCDKNRGDAKNRLFILNHFLTDSIARPSFAREINVNPLFVDRALECQKVWNKLPNFLTVDFYDIGNVFDVARQLNTAQ